MQVTFFGTDADIAQIWRWLFDVPSIKLCEEYSRPDHPVRWFETWDAFEKAGGASIDNLVAWSPDFGVEPTVETIAFAPKTQRQTQAVGRTVLRSPAFIRAGRNNDQNGCLASASFSCWNEKGARMRSVFPPKILDGVDWKALDATSSKVIRQLRKAAPAKLRAYPIMPDAWAGFEKGEMALWNWGSECRYPSELISEK